MPDSEVEAPRHRAGSADPDQLAALQARVGQLAEALEQRPTGEAVQNALQLVVNAALSNAEAAFGQALAVRPTEDATRAAVAQATAQLRAELAEALEQRPTAEAVSNALQTVMDTAHSQARADFAQELAEALANRPTEDATRALIRAAVREAEGEMAHAIARRPTEDTTRALVQAAVSTALVQAETELAESAETAAARLGMVEQELRQTVAALAEEIEAQRAAMATLATRVAGTRTELEALRAVQQQLAAAPPGPDMAAFDRVRAEVGALLEDRRAATMREQDLSDQVSRLPEMVAALRSDMEDAINRVAEETAALTGSQAELATAQSDVERRLDGLAAAIEFGESGLHALEQRVVERLERVDAQLERLRPAPRPTRTPEVSLMETLDAQLQAAESRLAARAARRGATGFSNGSP